MRVWVDSEVYEFYNMRCHCRLNNILVDSGIWCFWCGSLHSDYGSPDSLELLTHDFKIPLFTVTSKCHLNY